MFMQRPANRLFCCAKTLVGGEAFSFHPRRIGPTAVRLFRSAMSLMGHLRPSHPALRQSNVRIDPKADKRGCGWIVRFVPETDSCTAANNIPIRSPRRHAAGVATTS